MIAPLSAARNTFDGTLAGFAKSHRHAGRYAHRDGDDKRHHRLDFDARLEPRRHLTLCAAAEQSDEWRHYNALYFPYIAGLKPYSRRLPHDRLDPPAQLALEWFQATVPERTLYNWQNAAAKLVAQDLREGMQLDEGPRTKDE